MSRGTNGGAEHAVSRRVTQPVDPVPAENACGCKVTTPQVIRAGIANLQRITHTFSTGRFQWTGWALDRLGELVHVCHRALSGVIKVNIGDEQDR